MRVERSDQVIDPDEVGKRPCLRPFNLPESPSKLRRYVRKAQPGIHLFLGGLGDAISPLYKPYSFNFRP